MTACEQDNYDLIDEDFELPEPELIYTGKPFLALRDADGDLLTTLDFGQAAINEGSGLTFGVLAGSNIPFERLELECGEGDDPSIRFSLAGSGSVTTMFFYNLYTDSVRVQANTNVAPFEFPYVLGQTNVGCGAGFDQTLEVFELSDTLFRGRLTDEFFSRPVGEHFNNCDSIRQDGTYQLEWALPITYCD